MLIRGSKMVGNGFLFDFETGVVQGLDDEGDLEVIESITLLSLQSNGFINSPYNPDSLFNPVNFVEDGDDNTGETEPYSYPKITPSQEGEGGDNGNTENTENTENTGNNGGDGENNDGSEDNSNDYDSGHHSSGVTGSDGISYFNPESEIDVPLVLGENQPNNMIKGQTWLTFDEHGQGVLQVYNGQEWSKVGEELQPLDIGTY